MKKKEIIEETKEFVKRNTEGAESGHDWWHIFRVWKLSKHIAGNEDVDIFIVELGALFHDIADSKFHEGDEEKGPRIARKFLSSFRIQESIIEHIEKIIKNISFKNNIDKTRFKSKELDVIQDADRLDAMGAIGIARAFNYGGYKNREIYNPEIKPNLYPSKEEYINSNSPTINHFYEKLLLIKEKMNTETGRAMAERRHRFMEEFLQQFYKDWNIEV